MRGSGPMRPRYRENRSPSTAESSRIFPARARRRSRIRMKRGPLSLHGSENVIDQIHRHHAARDEGHRRYHRSRGEPADAAYAVAAGASVAEPRAEADQQSGQHQHAVGTKDPEIECRWKKDAQQYASGEESRDE